VLLIEPCCAEKVLSSSLSLIKRLQQIFLLAFFVSPGPRSWSLVRREEWKVDEGEEFWVDGFFGGVGQFLREGR
jgi:hypothetical protein